MLTHLIEADANVHFCDVEVVEDKSDDVEVQTDLPHVVAGHATEETHYPLLLDHTVELIRVADVRGVSPISITSDVGGVGGCTVHTSTITSAQSFAFT